MFKNKAALYKDGENVKKDQKTLEDIISRQNHWIILDALALHISNISTQYKLKHKQREELLQTVLTELKDAILEEL